MLSISLRWALIAIVCQASLSAQEADWPSPVTWKPDQRAIDCGLYIQPHPLAKREKVEFSVIEPSGVARKNYPVRGSVPLYRGELIDSTKVRLLNASGKEVPVQAKITGFWPEKSARFLCLDFLTDIGANEEIKLTLEYGSEVKSASPSMKITATDGGKGVDIATGLMAMSFKTGTDFLLVTPPKQKALKPVTGQAVVCADDKGGNAAKLPLIIDEVAISEQGPVQATVHLTGHYGTDKSGPPADKQIETWKYPVSLYARIYAGTGHMYVEHSFGYNADEYKEFVQSYGFTIPTGMTKGKFAYGPDEVSAAESALGVRLNQYAHNEWTLTGKSQASGKRFGGWGAIKEGTNQVLIGMREAWQQWPVAIRADENGDLTYEILGEKPDRVLDLRYEDRSSSPVKTLKSHSMFTGEELSWYYYNEGGTGQPGGSARGLMKLHELFIDFAPAAPAPDMAKAFHKPLIPWPGQNRFRDTKSFGHIAVYGDPKYDPAREYYSVVLDGLPVAHEANGMYGWVDWGDMPMVEGVAGDRLKFMMEGGLGWSDGERAVQSYFFHYIAGGGRRFLDLGHSFVHHTAGIDTEHFGGDTHPGCHMRHNQVHWRHPGGTRQGGYRGWHAYYWLTGDPEIGRLAIVDGVDAVSNRSCINLTAPPGGDVVVGSDCQHSAGYTLATCCWITSGDWRYARAHHAIAKLASMACEQDKDIVGGWTFFRVDKNGEPIDYQLCKIGDGTFANGYWFTYGGDDQLVDWASLTGDPVAVDTLIGLIKRHKVETLAGYHSPEGFYVGAALLTHDDKIRDFLKYRYPALGWLDKFKNEGRKSLPTFSSAQQWADIGGSCMFFKNGLSICGAQAYEFLYWAYASEVMENCPAPQITMPASAKIAEGKSTVPIEVDGSKSQKGVADIVKYEWTLNDKPVGTGPKATIPVAAGANYVGLKVTDAKGFHSATSKLINVLASDTICQLAFFGPPPGYMEAQRTYDPEAGYGWVQGGQPMETGEGYADKDKARGCACFFTNRTGTIVYQIKVQPGAYHVEIGAAALMVQSAMPVSLQDKVIWPGIRDSRGIAWNYDGDITVGAEGLIKIRLDDLKDDNGKQHIEANGNNPAGVLNYIVVKKKKK